MKPTNKIAIEALEAMRRAAKKAVLEKKRAKWNGEGMIGTHMSEEIRQSGENQMKKTIALILLIGISAFAGGYYYGVAMENQNWLGKF